MTLTNEMREAVYRELLSNDSAMNEAMLSAASKIPLERENGGLEYPVIRAFRVMVKAAAESRGVTL